MLEIAGHTRLTFRLYATGQGLTVDGGHLSRLVTAGLNSVTMIVGFAVFAAIRRTLAFDQRLVFAGYRQATLIGAKALAIAVVAATVAAYPALVLLAFWRPGPAGWAAILVAFTVIALAYGRSACCSASWSKANGGCQAPPARCHLADGRCPAPLRRALVISRRRAAPRASRGRWG